MNSFLHQLDLELEKVVVSWGGTQVFYYAWYADDMVFGIPRGEESSEVVTLLRETLVRTFSGLRLEFTSKDILRGRSPTKQTPGNLQVLGLLVALNEENGQLNIGIPLRRWGNRLTVALGRLQKEGQEINLTNGASVTKGAHQALLILRPTG